MSIQSIIIKNYKSIAEIKIDLGNKRLIPLIGINNVGKTNILDALNAIKRIKTNNYNYWNPYQPNFRVTKDSYNSNNNILTNFYFEVEYLFSNSKFTEKIFINKDSKNNAIPLLNELINKNINSCKNIVNNHFKNKYILQKHFDYFIEVLKEFLEDTSEINLFRAENFLPFEQNISLKSFLSNNYVFSEKEINNIIDELSKFIESFKELKKIVLNYDFSNQIFYISTASEVYDNFQIFVPINLSKDLIKVEIYNNYLSALIYFNEDYEIYLEKIDKLLNNKKQTNIKNVIEEVNEILKAEFSLSILNQNDESYIIYPEFYITDKNFLNSELMVIKKNKQNLPFKEPISWLSQGLRNKLILKLNLEYCKKYSDREIILLLDEPDQGLHISAILELYDELKTITEKTKTKIIYTTHSPYLLGHIFETYKDILIVEKDDKNKTILTKEFHNIPCKCKELKDTALEKMLPITGNDYLIMNAMNCRNFRYITVEGKTDYSFFNWYNKNYFKNKSLYFISINSKYNTKLINHLKISNLKYISLYDNDYENKDGKDIDKKRIIKYDNIFSDREIKDLETLLKNKKDKHLKYINKNNNNILNNYYQKLLENSNTKKNIEVLFKYLDQEIGELND